MAKKPPESSDPMARNKGGTDWLAEIAQMTDTCPECKRTCLRAINQLSGKTGLLDSRASVMVGFEPETGKQLDGNTANDFLLKGCDCFTLKDGGKLAADRVRFLPAHKFTCSKRARSAPQLISAGMADWVLPLVQRACPKCSVPLVFICNRASGTFVPCDARAPVYVVFSPEHSFMSTTIGAEVATDFLKRVDRVVLHGGVDISPEKLRFFVSHFATCTDPDQFRKPYGGRK